MLSVILICLYLSPKKKKEYAIVDNKTCIEMPEMVRVPAVSNCLPRKSSRELLVVYVTVISNMLA